MIWLIKKRVKVMTTNTTHFQLVSIATVCSLVKSCSSLLAYMTMPTQPIEMHKRPLISYFGTSFSPRKYKDSKTVKMIPTTAFTAIRVRSRKGRTKMWMIVPRKRKMMPRVQRHEQ